MPCSLQVMSGAQQAPQPGMQPLGNSLHARPTQPVPISPHERPPASLAGAAMPSANLLPMRGMDQQESPPGEGLGMGGRCPSPLPVSLDQLQGGAGISPLHGTIFDDLSQSVSPPAGAGVPTPGSKGNGPALLGGTAVPVGMGDQGGPSMAPLAPSSDGPQQDAAVIAE